MGFKDAKKGTTLCRLEVVERRQVSPHIVRVTLSGEDLGRLPSPGYDHWFRFFLPQEDGETSFDLPEQLGMAGYLKYLRMPSAVRPIMRNYTVRELRPEALELDIDFVVHGDEGPASRWAQRVEPGGRVALLDQGRGYEWAADTSEHLLVGDETAMSAILGILRDLPGDASGTAIIEVPESADMQECAAPDGIEVRWIDRSASGAGRKPGLLALEALRALVPAAPGTTSAYVCGEQELAAEGRRHLVAAGVPKARIAFVGYWRAGKAAY